MKKKGAEESSQYNALGTKNREKITSNLELVVVQLDVLGQRNQHD